MVRDDRSGNGKLSAVSTVDSSQQAPCAAPYSPIALIASMRQSVISASQHFSCATVLGRRLTTHSDLSLSKA
jgi:hypothetical protein